MKRGTVKRFWGVAGKWVLVIPIILAAAGGVADMFIDTHEVLRNLNDVTGNAWFYAKLEKRRPHMEIAGLNSKTEALQRDIQLLQQRKMDLLRKIGVADSVGLVIPDTRLGRRRQTQFGIFPRTAVPLDSLRKNRYRGPEARVILHKEAPLLVVGGEARPYYHEKMLVYEGNLGKLEFIPHLTSRQGNLDNFTLYGIPVRGDLADSVAYELLTLTVDRKTRRVLRRNVKGR